MAIGTWPTPEKTKVELKRNANWDIAIDSVPLPEKSKYLKTLVNEMLELVSDLKVEQVFESLK